MAVNDGAAPSTDATAGPPGPPTADTLSPIKRPAHTAQTSTAKDFFQTPADTQNPSIGPGFSPPQLPVPSPLVQATSTPPPPTSATPHIKTHHHCTTTDGWRLHLVRTCVAHGAADGASAAATGSTAAASDSRAATAVLPARRCPVVLCPGLGSSGAYTFDLSPVVSLADHLASRGWDVWTVELRGNGQSDRPRLFVRSRWWTIDDYVTKDVPAVLSYVRHVSGAARVHMLGHSMGGMILTRLLALGGEAAEAVASATVVGSGCFLAGSWWQALQHTMWVARFLWLVPAGATLRAYSPLALGRAGLSLVDELYFWPPNTDPVLARAVLARNFSAISGGVILQIRSGFGPRGVMTADGREAFADPARLARVTTPVLFMCGDRDRMCPPQGAAATCALFTGSCCARYVELGPRYGSRDHYGHFDILMGRRAEREVFPRLTEWLEQHDGNVNRDNDNGAGGAGVGHGIGGAGGADAAGVRVPPPRPGAGAGGVVVGQQVAGVPVIRSKL